jgi:hypothetical protein
MQNGQLQVPQLAVAILTLSLSAFPGDVHAAPNDVQHPDAALCDVIDLSESVGVPAHAVVLDVWAFVIAELPESRFLGLTVSLDSAVDGSYVIWSEAAGEVGALIIEEQGALGGGSNGSDLATDRKGGRVERSIDCAAQYNTCVDNGWPDCWVKYLDCLLDVWWPPQGE